MPRSKRALALRIARNLAIAAVAFWLVYVIAGNILLSTGAIERLVTGSAGGQRLTIGSASTWWFGKVHARDLSLRIQDSNIECLIVAPEVDLSVALTHLPLHTFYAKRVQIQGLRFYFRAKVDSIRGIEQRASAWPPIPEMPDPPLRPLRPKAPPNLKEIYQTWSVQLEQIDASLDELWMEELRYRGSGRVSGAFLLRPSRLLQIMSSRVTLSEGHLTIGPHSVTQNPNLDVGCVVRPFDTMAGRGQEVFEEFSCRLSMDAEVRNLAFLGVYLTPKPLASIRSGPGRLRADIDMVHGKIRPSSSLVFTASDVNLLAGEVEVESNIRFEASTPPEGKPARVALRTEDTTLQNEHGTSMDAGPVVVPEASVSIDLEDADLTKPIKPASAYLRVPQAEADARWINGLAGSPARWHAVQGKVRASTELRFDPSQHWTAEARVHVSEGLAGGNGWSAGGNLSVAARANANADGKTGSIPRIDISGNDLHIVAKNREESGVWLRAIIEQGSWNGMPPREGDAVVRVSAGPGGDVLRMITGESLLARLGVELTAANEVTAVARGRLRRGHKELELLKANAGLVEGTGSWVNGNGSFLLRAGPASAKVTTGGKKK